MTIDDAVEGSAVGDEFGIADGDGCGIAVGNGEGSRTTAGAALGAL